MENRSSRPFKATSRDVSPNKRAVHDDQSSILNDRSSASNLGLRDFQVSQSMQNMMPQESQPYLLNQFNHNAYQDNTQYTDPSLDPNLLRNDFYTGSEITGGFGSDFGFANTGFLPQQNINPADLSNMTSPDGTSPQSAGMLSPESQHHSQLFQNGSPTSVHAQFYTPQHSRHVSLDPNSAYENWQGMQFHGHRRAGSDQFSDASSVHQGSPYLTNIPMDTSHLEHTSPYLAPQDVNTYGMEGFNITDATSQPGSTYVSPRLMPAQELASDIGQSVNFSSQNMFNQPVFPDTLHTRHVSSVSDAGPGQANQFAPPTIQIDPAPISRQQSLGPNGEHLQANNTLSPPVRGRNRAASDTTGLTRPIASRSVSPAPKSNLVPRNSSAHGTISRSSSPGVASGRVTKLETPNRDRRASTSLLHSRDYYLDLANPEREAASSQTASPSSVTEQNNTSTSAPPLASNNNSSRLQKHPATFQCTLCPKKFTRAYNLRSHLRTHTDERPFVCTVCGKAFARQHDRKRHEGLHSGEKKFICKGELRGSAAINPKTGLTETATWGCGRRFARADALGRHFRSEAGRVCIKPLLDEELREKEVERIHTQGGHPGYGHNQGLVVTELNTPGMMGQNQHAYQQSQGHFVSQSGDPQTASMPGMSLPPDPGTTVTGSGPGHFALPAALMAQYPQLANIDWNALSQQRNSMAAGGVDLDLDEDYDGEGDLSDMGEVGGYEGYDLGEDGSLDMSQLSGMTNMQAGSGGGMGVGMGIHVPPRGQGHGQDIPMPVPMSIIQGGQNRHGSGVGWQPQ